MRNVIFNMMVSLDGFYEDRNGGIDWHYADDEHLEMANQMLAAADTLLMGRKTFELMAGYWPTAEGDSFVKQKMNELQKIVYSRSLKSAGWQNSVLGSANIAEEIRALKQQPGGNLVMLGSADLARTFVENDLFDEFQIMVCPILLGDGKSLFRGLTRNYPLCLLQSKARRSGVVELVYEPARRQA